MTVAPGLDKVCRDEPGPTDGGDQDVSRGRDTRQVNGPRMTDRHGRVPMEEQHRHRFSDNVAPSDHHGPGALDLDLTSVQKLDDSRRRARREGGTLLDQTAPRSPR